MELKVGDIVSLKSDTSISYTVGALIKNAAGAQFARIFWFSRLTHEIKHIEIPVEALTT